MKFIIFLFIPIFSFSQIKLEKISLVDNKVEILAPKELSKMTAEMWALKYHTRPRPTTVLTDENGEVNLIADMTEQPITESRLVSFKGFQIRQLKNNHPELELLEDSIKVINGRKVGYFKFITNATDQKIFNYYFFTPVDGLLLMCTFNCTKQLQEKWEKSADKIMLSLTVK